MGNRITQTIYQCSICEKVPKDGEYMWHMGSEILCEECCNKDDNNQINNTK